jgi:hypothetical protein
MGGSSVKLGRSVQPGEEIDINVNLRAPQTYGVFQGFWQHARPARSPNLWRDGVGGHAGAETRTRPVVTPAPTPPPAAAVALINPKPARRQSAYIAAGQCTDLRWEIDNVNSIFLIDGGNQQGVGGHDARTVCPGATTTYTLRVVGNDGASRDFPITVNVSGSAGYSINFWTDRDAIDAGQCTTLRWDVRNVQAVYLDGEGVAGVSQREVCPGDTKHYNL